MKHLGLVFGIYAAAVLETGPAGWTSHTGMMICPLYLLACLAAWTNAPVGAALWGGVAGLVADTLTTGPLGIETVLVATLAWAAASWRVRHQWHSLLAFSVFSVTVIAGMSLCSRLVHVAMSDQELDVAELVLTSAGAAIATALCGLALMAAGRALNRATRTLSAHPY